MPTLTLTVQHSDKNFGSADVRRGAMDTFAVDGAAGEAECGPPLLARVYLELALVPCHRHPAPSCTHTAN
jgi:hypothetical protein